MSWNSITLWIFEDLIIVQRDGIPVPRTAQIKAYFVIVLRITPLNDLDKKNNTKRLTFFVKITF